MQASNQVLVKKKSKSTWTRLVISVTSVERSIVTQQQEIPERGRNVQ